MENSSNTSNSDQEYPGLQIQNLRTALERGQMNTSLGNMNSDIQNFYHKLKEIQRSQPPSTPTQVNNTTTQDKPKSSFSIDSLAKSSKPSVNEANCESNNQCHSHQQLSAAGFNAQHQELYRKALENLHNAQRLQHVPSHGYYHIKYITFHFTYRCFPLLNGVSPANTTKIEHKLETNIWYRNQSNHGHTTKYVPNATTPYPTR